VSKRLKRNQVKGFLVPVVIFLAISQQVAGKPFSKNGMSFEDKSAVLDFRRGGGEGLGGAAWLDYDKDGDLDLFMTNGRKMFNNSPGRFENGLFRRV